MGNQAQDAESGIQFEVSDTVSSHVVGKELRRARVWSLMADEQWHSTMDINAVNVGGSEGCRRLREIKSDAEAGHLPPYTTIEGERKEGKTSQWQYRLSKEPVANRCESKKKPIVVALCGSTRFIENMAIAAWNEEKKGKIALSCHLLPGWYTNIEHHLAERQGVAEQLDELHLRKIDLCDEILVIDIENYIGDSTRREIDYARTKGKKIRWLSKEGEMP